MLIIRNDIGSIITDPRRIYVDQKHYQTAEKEPIEVMQMYFTAQELYGFCKGNTLKYILRSRFKGTELKDMEKALQYMKWSVDVLRGVPIDPRKR